MTKLNTLKGRVSTFTFKAALYRFSGRTFLCPESDLKEGELVIAFSPLKQVDPANRFAFVVNGSGTHSVSRKRISKIKEVTVRWERHQLMTHNRETEIKLEEMKNYLNQYLQKK